MTRIARFMRWQEFAEQSLEVGAVLITLAQAYGIPDGCEDWVEQVFLKAYARHHGPQAAGQPCAATRVAADLKEFDDPTCTMPLPFYVMSEHRGGV